MRSSARTTRPVGLLGIAATLLAGGAIISPWPALPAGPRVNLVLVSIDTLRADHVGSYGYELPTTPRIDAFSRQGVLFEQTIAAAPSTLASHASIFTSLVAPHHGASISRENSLPPDRVTLAEILRGSGYATASWNGGRQLHPVYGLDQGFDLYEVSEDSRIDTLDRFEPSVRAALDWIDRLDTDRPFFIFLHTYEAHAPYTPRPATRAHFGRFETRLADAVTASDLKHFNRGKWRLEQADLAHIVACYDAEIRSADNAFGLLLDGLQTRSLDDRTLVVLTSDHGEELGERGVVGRHAHSLFDEVLRVPLVMRLPGRLHAGTRVRTQVRGIDIAPTVLDVLERAPPAVFQGSSLLGLLEASILEPARLSLSAFDHGRIVALRNHDWKWFRGALYDLRHDPDETINLRRTSQDARARGRAMKRRADRWLQSRPRPSASAAKIDEELRGQLRALGYIR